MKTVSTIATELADREAIRECIYRYCRGIDRLDRDLLVDVYWPEATDEHTGFTGSPQEFIDHVFKALGPLDQTMHAIANMLIEIDGNIARTEAYFHAFHRIPGEAGPRDLIVGGRYVDRMEKRDDIWRIADRVVIIDWMRYYADSADWSDLPLGIETKPGERKPTDRSYTLLYPDGDG